MKFEIAPSIALTPLVIPVKVIFALLDVWIAHEAVA